LDRSAESPGYGIFFRGMSYDGLPGGVNRDNYGDLAKIYIGPIPSYPEHMLPSALQPHYHSYAATLLHEVIHALTYGSDDRLARNLQSLGIVPTDRNGNPIPFPTNGSIYDYSAYWDAALKDACFPELLH